MGKGIEGLVSNVQRFSVHDGPGIRTTVFLKGCPLRCPWCQNPESLRPSVEVAFYAERCRSAGDCFAACAPSALRRDAERVVRERCDGCGGCVPACPFGAFQLVGLRVTVAELVDEVLRDRPFFDSSGGGVTLSGGEPTFQLEFASAFARALRERGVGCGLQTCGAFRWERFAAQLPLFDFIHFDLKLMDPDEHRALIGGDNRAILENARRLLAAGSRVTFRAPVVAGYTDTSTNLGAVAEFLREGGVRSLHLLAYHSMGEAKLSRVGFPIPPLPVREPLRGERLLARAAERLRAHGIEVTT